MQFRALPSSLGSASPVIIDAHREVSLPLTDARRATEGTNIMDNNQLPGSLVCFTSSAVYRNEGPWTMALDIPKSRGQVAG